jgi:hypothetical protein
VNLFKPLLIILVIVLACTCWLTDSGGPPSPIPIGVTGTQQSSLGLTRGEDQMIPNFGYTADSKKIGIVTNINSRGTATGADLPYGASN